MDRQRIEHSYGAEDIQVLEGLDAVRKRPGMYIGSTDVRGLNHLVHEIFDNSVDEAVAGYGGTIEVCLNEDGSVTVKDNGRGMPVDMHALGKPTVEVILTELHAGGKFGGGVYKTSGGLHGVGSTVVNALSEYLEVKVHRNGKIYFMRFEEGKTVKPLEEIGETDHTGTEITFKPDRSIFSTVQFNKERLKDKLRESAYLVKGLKVIFKDCQVEDEEVYHYQGGIKQHVEEVSEAYHPLTEVQYFEFRDEATQTEGEIAYVWVEDISGSITSFANNVRTTDGGTHEAGFKAAITKAVNTYGKTNNLIKENLDGSIIQEGLIADISVRLTEDLLQFVGQTKDKLGSSEVRAIVEGQVYEHTMTFLNLNANFSKTLVENALEITKLKEKQKNERLQLKKAKSKKTERALSKKLVEPISKDVTQRELFIVEGKTNWNCPSYLTHVGSGGLI